VGASGASGFRRWQRDKYDLGALAAYSQDAVAVFLAKVADAGAAGFEDPQPEHRDEREVVRVVRQPGGARDPDTEVGLVHAWLHFENGPPIQLHGVGDHFELSLADPYAGYDMQEAGEVRVAAAAVPDPLAGMIGRRLTDAAVALGPFGRAICAGLLLRLDGTDVVIGTLGDEWVIRGGPPSVQLPPCWIPQPWIMQG
jgi:hypothetical protein